MIFDNWYVYQICRVDQDVSHSARYQTRIGK